MRRVLVVTLTDGTAIAYTATEARASEHWLLVYDVDTQLGGWPREQVKSFRWADLRGPAGPSRKRRR